MSSPKRHPRWGEWWPWGLAIGLGLVLLADRWGLVELEAWVASLVRITFFMAVAGVVIGDTMRFLVWWFWTRQQP